LREFPKDTVHIVGIGAHALDDIPHLGIRYQDQYILTADNGFFSLFAEQHPDLIVELQMNVDTDVRIFPIRDLYAPAAVFLANGGTLEVIGRRVQDTAQGMLLKPLIGNDYIKGSIIYVDSYGNAISNIDHKLMKEVGKGKEFTIGFVRMGYEIHEFSKRYSDVREGERLALINSAGHLEIAINKGHAANLLGLQFGEAIIMTFD
jgi:S-adenosylmethionine hydrolase